MVSEKFRRQLRQEAIQWQSESLISPELFHELADRYDFDNLETSARDRFIAILVSIGGILLGIGIITFVAANWQAIPRPAKVVLLLTVLIAVNTIGFYLWRSPPHSPTHSPTHPLTSPLTRLGHGLLICGTLALGANLALMGQIFHQTGTAFGFCLLWGAGVLAMAYGLQLTSIAAIAAIVVNIGYWLELANFPDLSPPFSVVFNLMPLVLLIGFLPLAHICRSRLVFGLTIIGIGTSLGASLVRLPDNLDDPFGITVAIAVTLPVALWWAYDDQIWRDIQVRLFPGRSSPPAAAVPSNNHEPSKSFRRIGRSLSVVYLGLLFYIWSFHSVWGNGAFSSDINSASPAQLAAMLVTNPNCIVIALLTLALWIRLGWPRIGQQWRLTATDGVILVMLVVTGIVVLWDAIALIEVGATVIINILLFVLAAGLMREGLAEGDRRQFWFGLVLLMLQIVSRVFEYDTGLLLKSFTFLLCGVAVILIGLWFERYVRTFGPASPSPQLQSNPPYRTHSDEEA
jgi:uncharacterized membrane protein